MDNFAHADLEMSTPERPSSDLKRKRSSSNDDAVTGHPTKKSASSAHLQINYLARQNSDDLPLVSEHDPLSSLIAILSDYAGVLERHESMAVNLGARPLGPILIHRFERLFDGPPRVLKSHGKEGTTVTWLDVVEFARNKPEQFQLGQMSEGARVCQFYTKQCRVQISEDDFVLINSGIPQKMIPPQPISEDEEKELGTIEILEKTLGHLSHLADQVAARTRQLNHRLKGRKQAILDRRAVEQPISGSAALRASSPSNVALMNGANPAAGTALAGLAQASQGGFVAVNSKPPTEHNGNHSAPDTPLSRLDPGPKNAIGASPQTHAELMNRFSTVAERKQQAAFGTPAPSHSTGGTPTGTSQSRQNGSKGHYTADFAPFGSGSDHLATNRPAHSHLSHSASHPSRPSSTNHSNSHHGHSHSTDHSHSNHHSSSQKAAAAAADEGPYKAAMVSRMETLQKGDRILPPCDRCRRLHMDCLKNLTACMGCTKKHAKCSWREVKPEELQSWDSTPTNPTSTTTSSSTTSTSASDPTGLLDRRPSTQSDTTTRHPLGLSDGFPGFRTANNATTTNTSSDDETYAALARETQRARDEEGLIQARALALAQLQAQNASTAAETPLAGLNATAPLQSGGALSQSAAAAAAGASLAAVAASATEGYANAAAGGGGLSGQQSPLSTHLSGTGTGTSALSSIPTSAISEASFRPIPTPTSATVMAGEAGMGKEGGEVKEEGVEENEDDDSGVGHEDEVESRRGSGSAPDEDEKAVTAEAMARAAAALGYVGAATSGGGGMTLGEAERGVAN
ncbi:hypothetical protein EV356DRAFT_537871 [Viridothelium virens]|uniref:Zn(2)-C6 fungal-type domain-containing protein n=1 Tax=Viridothelium virens TaxID=1048519 RepID=A0A6A6GT70_VIRVR|nr:hypothetical protein EV356DRAFT_537871 [Viridothelium virens]